MVRSRSFDEAQVLTDAMNAFRQHGFAGVSIKTLEAATGLTSGSIYNAYGDKDGVYRAALNHYIDAVIRWRLDTYIGAEGGVDGVERLFLSLLSDGEANPNGCLLTNAAVEFGAGPSVATQGVQDGLALLEAGMRDALLRDIDAEHVDRAVTRLLLIYQGILVLRRAGRDISASDAVVRDEFDHLRKMRKSC
ncbi:regulatory protein TetR [Sphingobium chlorophenolicum L-1]|uniref:Regulatory protein TetR n=1 Tax=Sphingobium chlorophenolicum L-1 TaxID=690566 RepID=F6F3M9_SPHCR|nr:TetR/AcrR family transcriptional regulator [Sphingobium chlorophenolicum]AEG51041.1 regulatory protein TetR [Sphingobium chlorophenolicum L-1]